MGFVERGDMDRDAVQQKVTMYTMVGGGIGLPVARELETALPKECNLGTCTTLVGKKRGNYGRALPRHMSIYNMNRMGWLTRLGWLAPACPIMRMHEKWLPVHMAVRQRECLISATKKPPQVYKPSLPVEYMTSISGQTLQR